MSHPATRLDHAILRLMARALEDFSVRFLSRNRRKERIRRIPKETRAIITIPSTYMPAIALLSKAKAGAVNRNNTQKKAAPLENLMLLSFR